MQRVDFDYGYDLYAQTFDDEGYVENGFCLLQLKATSNVSWVANRTECTLVLERRDMEMWQQERLPVFLVLYDAMQDCAYRLDVQAMQTLTQPESSATVTVRIPTAQLLDEAAVAQMQERKNRISLRERGEHEAGY